MPAPQPLRTFAMPAPQPLRASAMPAPQSLRVSDMPAPRPFRAFAVPAPQPLRGFGRVLSPYTSVYRQIRTYLFCLPLYRGARLCAFAQKNVPFCKMQKGTGYSRGSTLIEPAKARTTLFLMITVSPDCFAATPR